MTIFPASLHPPSHGDLDLADATRPDWVLLDFRAYFSSCRNATTASCKTGDGLHDIQVTFFPAPPPRVSHFCFHCSGLGSDGFVQEPMVVATDSNFVLLRITYRHPSSTSMWSNLHEYFIYSAHSGRDGRPSLESLPKPNGFSFHDNQVGLISHGTNYTIAALCDDSSAFLNPSFVGQYYVFLFNSEDKFWSVNPVIPPWEEEHKEYSEKYIKGLVHQTDKVIYVGGEHGTIAFADLWRGILLYDVFRPDPVLRYIALPKISYPSILPDVTPSIIRDIAFVKDSIKLVQIAMLVEPEYISFYGLATSHGWVASTWSTKAPFHRNSHWTDDCMLNASDINCDNNPAYLDMLKELSVNEGKPVATLENFYVGHPTLSLDNDDIVYFMAKAEDERKAWIIALDMSRRMLQAISEFSAERTFGFSHSYKQSRISKYLNITPGTMGEFKRPGMPLQDFYNKKVCYDDMI